MTDKYSVKFLFRTLNLAYYSFLISGIILVALSLYFWKFDFDLKTTLSLEKKIILGAFVVVSTFLSQFIYKRTINRINPKDQLLVKLQAFQSAVIYRLSILEFTLIISLLFFLFTKLWSLIIIAVALLCLIILCKPNKRSFLKLFPLSSEEHRGLSNK